MAFIRHTQLIGTTAEWAENDPVLLKGELGYEQRSDGKWLSKMGDGEKKWSQLPYADQVFSTEAEKQAAIATAKAGEALASATAAQKALNDIPPDYQTLAGDVKTAKTEISQLSGEIAAYGLAVVDGALCVKFEEG